MTSRVSPLELYQHLAWLRRLSPQATSTTAYAERPQADLMAMRLSQSTGTPFVSTLEWRIDAEDPTTSEPTGWTWARYPV
jgi:hypothetical protein